MRANFSKKRGCLCVPLRNEYIWHFCPHGVHKRGLFGCHDDGILFRQDLHHIERFRCADAQSFALPQGVSADPVMFSELDSLLV